MRIALPAAALTLFAAAAFVQPSYAQAPYGSPPPDQQGSPYQQGGPGQYDPQGAPPPGTYQGPPPGMQNQQSMGQPPMGQPPMGQMRGREKFDAANVTHDGRLTRDQAAAGGLRAVARNFDAIDRDHKGYVTRQDLREWHQAKRAAMSGSQGPGPGGGPGPGQSMQGPPPQ